MRRRWFCLGALALFLWGLWVLEARPGELVPNEGGRKASANFVLSAFQPALNYEDPEMRGGAVSFPEKLVKSLWTTVRYAMIAMSLALVVGIIGGILGSRAWWSRPNLFLQVLRIGTRLLATAARSVHELLWAILFLAAVGTSPLVAILAMSLPYGGTLAKVFSELLDEAQSSSAEVIRSTGGGGFAAFFAGVVTRALPDLTSYALYRLECAVRSSAVLGFVGIPTVGYEIKTAFEDGHYREIWTYVYTLLIVVVLFEWWGARIRRILSKGLPSRAKEEKGQSLKELWGARGRSWFLRISVSLLALGMVAGWLTEDRWGAGISWEQRMRNLDRFTDEMVPHPIREKDGDWSIFGAWFNGKMSDEGAEALWRTFHLGTSAIMLAGGLALVAILFAARSLASRNPRGVREDGGIWREGLGSLLRGGAMMARAMPEYILAFLLLQVFGPTVWVLIFALAIHNGGILVRLGAEVVDNTRSQASEVVLAQGGSRASSYLGALLPTSFNRLVLFLFYRWESCVREATVLGMLGVASLGFLISNAKVSFYYDDMILWVGLGAALVFAGDVTSDIVRGKLRK